MLKRLLNLNLSPDAGEGGGDNGAGDKGELDRLAGNGDDGDGGKGGKEGEGKGEGDEGEGEGEGGKTGLTKDDITDILSRVIPAGGGQQEQRQPEKQYTQAEIESMLNVWKPDASFLRKLGFAEPTAEQLAAVHEMRDNLIKQANTMSEARVQQLLGGYKAQLEELSGYVSEQRAAADERLFYEKNKELEPYSEIVEAVSSKLEASGFKAPNKAKVFEEIARSTHEVLKRMNIKADKKQGAGAGASGNRGGSRMAQLSGGGHGGGGGGSKGGGQRRAGMEVFDGTD